MVRHAGGLIGAAAPILAGACRGADPATATMDVMPDSTVAARAVLTTLPAYLPGRTVPGAVKLASNESAGALLPEVVQSIAEAVTAGNRYPDAAATELSRTLATRFGVDAAQIAVGCGSVALCQQVIQAVADAGDEVLYPWRSFEAYPILTALAGARAVQVPVRADQTVDLDAVAAAVTERTKVVFMCTPNNPTGAALGRAGLSAFLDRIPDTVAVVVDEAYVEYVSDDGLTDGGADRAVDGMALLDRPNVVVLRTFSKAYGLAGLRVGYAVAADPALAASIRRTGLPFAVSSAAQAAALASLKPDVESQLMQRVSAVVAERTRVYDELVALGYDVTPSQANFVWLPMGADTTAWAAGCEQHGVIVRPFAGFGARVTISTADENDVFLSAAAALAPGRA